MKPLPITLGILALIIFVAWLTKEHMDAEEKGMSFDPTGCECKREYWGREIVATMCSAESTKGPWTRECLYARGKPIFWANQQRQEEPL